MGSLSKLMVMSCLMVGMGLSLPAAAKSSEGYSGWYVGAGAGVSRLQPKSNGSGYEVKHEFDAGLKVLMGYDLNKRWSAEGYFSELGEAQMRPSGKVAYRDYGIAGLYRYYTGNTPHKGFDAFLKAGFGYMENDTELTYERLNNEHFLLGAGFGYGFDNGVMLRADVDLYDEDSQLFTLNLIKRFGEHERPVAPAATQAVEEKPARVANVVRQAPADEDRDGVPDQYDTCPGTVTSPGIHIDQWGCVSLWVLEGVVFEWDKAVLKPESRAVLDYVANRIKMEPTGKRIRVMGHADSQGTDAYNMKLSKERAKKVFLYMVRRGVNPKMLSAYGYGERQPIANNSSKSGRARNRRVELHWH